MEVQMWPIEKLIFYARNPRKNDRVVDRMVASLREFGFKIPVLARSDGEVVDGHLRLKAARKLEIREVPVILCDEWSLAPGEGVPVAREPIGELGGLGRGTPGFGAKGSELDGYRSQLDRFRPARDR